MHLSEPLMHQEQNDDEPNENEPNENVPRNHDGEAEDILGISKEKLQFLQ